MTVKHVSAWTSVVVQSSTTLTNSRQQRARHAPAALEPRCQADRRDTLTWACPGWALAGAGTHRAKDWARHPCPVARASPCPCPPPPLPCRRPRTPPWVSRCPSWPRTAHPGTLRRTTLPPSPPRPTRPAPSTRFPFVWSSPNTTQPPNSLTAAGAPARQQDTHKNNLLFFLATTTPS